MNANSFFRLGMGCGIEIRGDVLRVTVVRSRRTGIEVQGYLEIPGFSERRASEWGAEYHTFLESLQLAHLTANVALPRSQVIVRELVIPAVSKKELPVAVDYQVENLHPFEPSEVCYAFAPLRPNEGKTALLPLAVVIAKKKSVDTYADLFEAAGIAVESFTVAAASFFGAVRVRWDIPPKSFLVADFSMEGLELYGEGTRRSLLSTWFGADQIPSPHTLSLTGSDLRLETDHEAKFICVGETSEKTNSTAISPEKFDVCRVEDLLPLPVIAPVNFDTKNTAVSYAVALDAACPRMGWRVNLLSTERRKKNSRWMYLPTAVLVAACLLLAFGFLLRGWIQDGNYVRAIKTETAKLNLTVEQVNALDTETNKRQEKYATLEALDSRTGFDLQIMSELSNLLPDTVWLTVLEMDDSGVRIRGIAKSASPLLVLINEASSLVDAEFLGSIVTTKDGLERFQMTVKRRLSQLSNE